MKNKKTVSIRQDEKKSFGTFIIISVFSILAILIIGLRGLYQINFINVDGVSMEPTLVNNQKVISYIKPDKLIGENELKISRGNIVIFDSFGVDPLDTERGKIYIKRVIGLPGDSIKFDGQNIYINGVKSNQSFLNTSQREEGSYGPSAESEWTPQSLSKTYNWNSDSKNLKENKVPKGMYFVMGDNRGESNDSRYFGFVKKSSIKGTVHSLSLDDKANKKINDETLK